MADKKYTINTPGGDFTISIDNGGWASEDTLSAIARALKAKTDTVSKSSKDFKDELSKSNRKGIIWKIKDTGETFEDLQDEVSRTERAFQGFATVLGSAGDVAAGLLTFNGKLTDINPVVENVTGRIAKFGQYIPEFEIAGFGINAGQAAKATAELTRDFIQLTTVISQQVLDSFDNLITVGITPNVFNFNELSGAVAGAKVPLLELSTIVSNASPAIRSLGTDSEQGLTKFIDSITYANTGLRDQFMMLGMGTVETAEFMAEFIEANRRGMQFQNMDFQTIANSALALSKELNILAELTGKDVDALKQEYLQTQITQGAQLKLARESSKFGDGFTDAYKLLQSRIGPVVDQIYQVGAGVNEFAVLNAIPGYVDNIKYAISAMSDSSLSSAEKQRIAGDAVAQNAILLRDAFESGKFTFAEYAGVVDDANGAVGTMADALLKGADASAMDITAENYQNIRKDTEESINDAFIGINGIVGEFKESVQNIEDAAANFSSFLLDTLLTEDGILQKTTVAIGDFYEMLGSSLKLPNPEDVKDQIKTDTVNIDTQKAVIVSPGSSREDWQNAMNQILGPDPDYEENALGGPVMPNTLTTIAEDGKGELLKIGNVGGEVINNATSRDIMSAANAVVNNMGTPNAGYGKQTLDVLTAMAKDQADTKRLLTRILPKAMTGNGYF